jgi:hypothetical protein
MHIVTPPFLLQHIREKRFQRIDTISLEQPSDEVSLIDTFQSGTLVVWLKSSL